MTYFASCALDFFFVFCRYEKGDLWCFVGWKKIKLLFMSFVSGIFSLKVKESLSIETPDGSAKTKNDILFWT